jgi:hypothetical protein
MAIERFYNQIGPVLFTADGAADGIISVVSTHGFKVKMAVVIKTNVIGEARFEIKRVLNDTQMIIGPENKPIHARSDLSAYLVADGAVVVAPFQERPKIPPADYERAVYEEEPVVAKRVFPVDEFGNPYNDENAFPVEVKGFEVGEINVDINEANTHNFAKVLINQKNTEVSFTFPNNVKYYKIKTRDSKDVVKIGLSPGAIAAGNYWTMGFGVIYDSNQFVDFFNGYTLFFESKFYDNVELEIFYYTKVV